MSVKTPHHAIIFSRMQRRSAGRKSLALSNQARFVKPLAILSCAAVLLLGEASSASANPAITAFNKWCFKAGQTESQARTNMNADTSPFTLTFWDDSLEPRPANAPIGVERRCEVAFDGDHTSAAIKAMREQMAMPPVFGSKIPLPLTHAPTPGTELIEGRELLRGRVAVVHVGTREINNSTITFMAVDRLYDGLGLTTKG